MVIKQSLFYNCSLGFEDTGRITYKFIVFMTLYYEFKINSLYHIRYHGNGFIRIRCKETRKKNICHSYFYREVNLFRTNVF